MNLRPSGYEPDELPGCSTPRYIFNALTTKGIKQNIFLHVSALEESKLRVLKEEQEIEFDIKEKEKKLQAINIKKL